MKMALHEIDEQIREVENRIAVERIALDDATHRCVVTLREALTSPKTLLALLGVGFAVGKVLLRDKTQPAAAPAQAKKAGVLGVLTGIAGTALSLAGGSRGGWGGIARWAAGKYFARKKAARGAGGPPPAKGLTAAELRTTPTAAARAYPPPTRARV